MEVPPVYAQPPRNKSKVGWIIAIALGCVLCCCGGPAFFGLRMINGTKPFLTCVMAFKDVATGIRKYASDHKGVLPKAETWQDDVKKDYQQTVDAEPQNPFGATMPAEGDWACSDGDGRRTGISYNSALSGKKIDSIGDQVSTIMIFETEKVERNQHGKFSQPNYQASPKIIFGAPRGWAAATVAGQSGLIGERGQFAPVDMRGGRGVSVNVDAGNGVEIKK